MKNDLKYNSIMNSRDTTNQAEQVLIDIYRRMPAGVKLKRIFEACQTGKILKMAGLKQMHPDADEKQIWYLWAKQHLGDKLFRDVYGQPDDE